jgi:transcriptional regulator with XRE-family HTH domain
MRGSELRRLRRQLGWTQAQLAEALAVSRNTVVRWENDALGMRPSSERLIQVLFAQARSTRRRTRGK